MGTGLLEAYKKNVKREYKIAFIATILIGLFVHIFKFTNALPNHDTILNYYNSQNIIGSGRWLLAIACGFSSYFDLPWVNGILSLLFMGVAVALIVDVLEIKNPILIILTSGLLVAFPGVTETFFFEYTADGYMIAMALAAASVYFTTIERFSIKNALISLLCICCSCAIYQAYVSFAIVLAICYMILVILDNRYESKKLWSWVGKQAVIYASALALYYVLWKILMQFQGVTATHYQGIDSMGISLHNIKVGLASTVSIISNFFVEWNPFSMTNPFSNIKSLYAVLNAVFLFCLAAVLVYAIVKTKIYRRKGTFILLLIGCIGIPFASCIWMFTSENVFYRPMMLMSLFIVYVIAAVLFEKYTSVKWKNLFAGLLLIIIFNNSLTANISYYFMNRTYEATYATAVEMLAEVHDLEANTKEMLIVGTNQKELSLEGVPHSERLHNLRYIVLEQNMLYNRTHVIAFLNEMFYESFVPSDWDWENDAEAYAKIDKMGCWPASDSVQLINNVIVIKLNDPESEIKK